MTVSELYLRYLRCTGITTDTRTCTPGSMFIALRGTSFDGNKFAAQALQAGCAYAVVDNPAYAVAGDDRYLPTENSLLTLQALARHHRRQMPATVLGITGTNGKTTTKELIAAVLSQRYSVLYTEGNLNNHIGVPLTLLRLRPTHEFAVVEMGANHPGEIKTLCEIAEPDCGLITNVGKAHLEGFGSLKGVIRTKGELYDFLRKRPESVVFLNQDDTTLPSLAEHIRQITYGKTTNALVNGDIVVGSPNLSFNWQIGAHGMVHPVETRLIGAYNLMNALAAAAVGTFFQVSPEQIGKALTDYAPTNNRSQLLHTGSNTLIVDTYNANPTSMQASVEHFLHMDAANKLLILGDMLELGAESASEHGSVIRSLQAHTDIKVILVGNQFAAIASPFKTYRTTDELIADLKAHKPMGHTILLKGSHGIRLEKLIPYL
ncbi:MAG: UDP-N-acetylmuramoyl-tripeptide--D-alanyl-D-alanine ligase [Prevotellaceae bacterium]|jgi:UDP-N-acetylmuramoyl-tripeptide--D-alanyl-D-alanine ligase|nr:UDP-N-acetylmuramoyl-tripeptide--D-alanyl-D-alanine ligase [Prevotellaceae bacterium]